MTIGLSGTSYLMIVLVRFYPELVKVVNAVQSAQLERVSFYKVSSLFLLITSKDTLDASVSILS